MITPIRKVRLSLVLGHVRPASVAIVRSSPMVPLKTSRYFGATAADFFDTFDAFGTFAFFGAEILTFFCTFGGGGGESSSFPASSASSLSALRFDGLTSL